MWVCWNHMTGGGRAVRWSGDPLDRLCRQRPTPLRCGRPHLAAAIRARRGPGRDGIAYLLLLQGLTVLAAPALVLLLLFITGTGITVGTTKTTVAAAVPTGTTRAP